MIRYSKKFTVSVILFAVALSARWAQAQNGKATLLRETDTTVIDEKGDAKFTGKIVFPSEAAYSKIKGSFPNPNVLMRNLLGSTGKMELKDSVITYDDNKHAIIMSVNMYGAAVNKKNKWRIDIGKGAELLHVDGRTCVLMNVMTQTGMILIDSAKIELPAAAKRIKTDPEYGSLVYELEHEPVKGDVSLDVEMKVKARLMPAIHKVYGSSEYNGGTLWTAKTLFTNSGAGDITRLKVSYRIGDYTTWSPPTEYNLIVAGGHAVDLYYPLLNKEVTELKARTPVDLEVKYTYTDAAGKDYSDTSSKRITILGANGFEYSNLPDEERSDTWADKFNNDMLLAAFVTKKDDCVSAFGGLAAQACGGQPAGINDDAAIKFCKALYDLEIANGMAYQTGATLWTENGGVSQELKFPRDVLRDKSGTCIELAILYAAACETVGLQCHLITRPGHCYPVVQLPSGRFLAVESTCISGPAVDPRHLQPFSFDDAVKYGMEGLNKDTSRIGLFHLVDVEQSWKDGVSPPELGKLPADILQNWGWKPLTGQPVVPQPQPLQPRVEQNNPNPPQPRPQPPANDVSHPAGMIGTWNCSIIFRNGAGGMSIAMMLRADGTFATSAVSATVNETTEGDWKVEGNKFITTELKTGVTTVRTFGGRGDIIDINDANLGMCRFRKQVQ